MKKKNLTSFVTAVAALFALTSAQTALAADSLAVCESGVPFRYPGGGENIPFNPDQGGLGPLTNAQGVAAVELAFDAWENLPQSSMTASNNGPLPEDITIDNFGPVLNPAGPDGLSPIVFDETGEIFDLLFGPGSGILGFAGPDFGDVNTCTLTESSSFLNGPTFDDLIVAEDIMVHEFGHYMNLGHVELNGQLLVFDEGGDDTGPSPNNTTFPPPASLIDLIETMYPFYFGPLAGTRTPHADDVASFAFLYPATDFDATTGTISGSILAGANGDERISGVNVIARNISNPYEDAVSTFSGAYTDSTDPSDPNVGTYALRGLTPGAQYAVFIDQVTAAPNRFSNPVVTNLPGPEEFYNGADESNSGINDDPQAFVLITAEAGQPETGVDIQFNIPQPGEPLNVGDDGAVQVFMPFDFDFCGVKQNSVYVNANGHLTFGQPDPAFAESVEALLDGPPRIAPFWRDLNPTTGGTVSFDQTRNSFTVTYDQVPNWLAGGANTFSATLHRGSNRVTFEYGDLDPTTFDFFATPTATTPGLTGISCGLAQTSGQEHPRDFSRYGRWPIGTLLWQPAVYEQFEEEFDPETGTFFSTIDLANSKLRFLKTRDFKDRNEPNDSFKKATRVRLPYNTAPIWKYTEIDPAGEDADYYQFHGKAGDYLVAEVQRGQIDSTMCVFDPSGNLIDANDDSNGLLSQVITQLPVDGKYRVAVSTWPDLGCVGEGGTTIEPFGSGRYVLDMYIYEQAANELIFNGGFELGFAGWTTIDPAQPFIPWLIGQAGDGAGFGMQPVLPQEGAQVAWNGFDGAAASEFLLIQEFSVPAEASSATLSWKDRVQWNFFAPEPLEPREYFVFLVDGANNLVFVDGIFTGTVPAGAVDLGWRDRTFDMTPYAGQDVVLVFYEFIPEDFTGPGQLEIDAVSVTFE